MTPVVVVRSSEAQTEEAIGFLPIPLVVVALGGAAAVATQTNVGGDILEGIPGGSALAKGIQALIDGPLKDFANTPTGRMVLRAVATTAYLSASAYVGPQIAAMTFALPGLARGEEFTKAWTTEFLWRVEKTAEILGVGDAKHLVADETKRAIDQLWEEYGGEEAIRQVWEQYGGSQWLNGLAKRLAEKYGLREDAVASALSGILGIEPAPKADWFDPVTGRLVAATAHLYEGLSIREVASTSVQRSFLSALPYGGRLSRAGSTGFLAAGTYRSPVPALPSDVVDRAVVVAPVEPQETGTRTAGKVVLIGALGLAAAALVWFYVGE